ncbi:ABC transporter ATP-binding protein [Streptomyces sp. P38-E01]|uniref:ABC transporter ATP-binding protein n=1 Tax=Streptomyces tardus TaxID=2780544 RepID=A0A949JEL7_9ACTN|nr:ABC transporter ATP-binding protein [Streptomyces tardus]
MSIIEVSGLSKAYGPKRAVEDVSFEVREGEIFGVLGPNGAGKTTTVECVIGLRTPDTGHIRVAGLDPVTQRPALTRVLGAQLQEGELPPKITVQEVLELYAAFYPDPAPWRPLAERLGLGEKLTGKFQKLSGGQKQRLLIALALIGNPRVVVPPARTAARPYCRPACPYRAVLARVGGAERDHPPVRVDVRHLSARPAACHPRRCVAPVHHRVGHPRAAGLQHLATGRVRERDRPGGRLEGAGRAHVVGPEHLRDAHPVAPCADLHVRMGARQRQLHREVRHQYERQPHQRQPALRTARGVPGGEHADCRGDQQQRVRRQQEARGGVVEQEEVRRGGRQRDRDGHPVRAARLSRPPERHHAQHREHREEQPEFERGGIQRIVAARAAQQRAVQRGGVVDQRHHGPHSALYVAGVREPFEDATEAHVRLHHPGQRAECHAGDRPQHRGTPPPRGHQQRADQQRTGDPHRVVGAHQGGERQSHRDARRGRAAPQEVADGGQRTHRRVVVGHGGTGVEERDPQGPVGGSRQRYGPLPPHHPQPGPEAEIERGGGQQRQPDPQQQHRVRPHRDGRQQHRHPARTR